MNLAESETSAQGSLDSKPKSCAHCGSPLRSKDTGFCCKGCEFIYASIHALGLSNFYSVRADQIALSGQQIEPLKNYAYLSDPTVRAQLSEQLADGKTRIRFYLSTLHCTACVWILERLPHVVSGVHSARVSFANGEIEIVVDQEIITLEKLATVLHSIGYPPVAALKSAIEIEDKREQRAMLMRIGIAAVCAANTMMLADSLFQSYFTGMDQPYVTLFTWTSAIISLPAVTWAALPFYRSAISSFVTARAHIDLPISIAIIVSYISDLATTMRGSGHVYFDSITSLIFLLLVGRYVQRQALSRSRASCATSWDLFPTNVRKKVGDRMVEISLRDVIPGDILELRPEERIPSDAQIIAGSSSVDASFLTGESLPRQVTVGDTVLGGSINIDGVLEVAVREVGEKSRLGRILAALRLSQGRSTKIEDQANRISGYFVVTVLLLAAATFTYWFLHDSSRALPITISLLVITCPCALGLSIPATLAVALAQARTAGLFVQNSQALQTLARAQHFYFDKTGTLTAGKLKVEGFKGEPVALEFAKSLARASSIHPVSRALEEYCAAASAADVHAIQHSPGKGVQAKLGSNSSISLGSYKWFMERSVLVDPALRAIIQTWMQTGWTVSLVEKNGSCLAAFGLSDQILAHASIVISELQRKQKQVFILSGDTKLIVDAVAARLHIPSSNARAELYPEQKAEVIAADPMIKVFIGDGLNDAEAMQNADIGIGLRGGIESTLEVADIFVARAGLEGFSNALQGSHKIRRVIEQNLAFSFAYNLVGAVLAVSGHVTPLIAAILMPISSLSVILSASVRRYFKISARA